MDFRLFSLSLVILIVGIITMIKNKFNNYDFFDMLFSIKLRMFLCGLLLSLLGLCGIISEILKLLK